MQTLYLIRGLPGSGKSTFARTKLPRTYSFYEADMFFINTFSLESSNTYNWSPHFLHEAHTLCRMNTIKALYHGDSVAVANTFTTLKEIAPYIDLKDKFPGLNIVIYEMKTQYKSIHNVPDEAIARMKSRWQELPESPSYEVTQVKE